MDADAHHHARSDGSVVLDIGGDIGAAVVHTSIDLLGEEIEIRAAGDAWSGRHVAVHRRDLPGGPVYAAVFPQLGAGPWEVRKRADVTGPVLALDVVGGQVTTATLPTG